MEELEKKYIDLLFTYAGFFEEIFDKDPDFMERDNYNDYKAVIEELRRNGRAISYNSTLAEIKRIEKELPFDLLNDPGF